MVNSLGHQAFQSFLTLWYASLWKPSVKHYKQKRYAKHSPKLSAHEKKYPFRPLKRIWSNENISLRKRMDHKNGMPNTITLPETNIAREIQCWKMKFPFGMEVNQKYSLIYIRKKKRKENIYHEFKANLTINVGRYSIHGAYRSGCQKFPHGASNSSSIDSTNSAASIPQKPQMSRTTLGHCLATVVP